MGMILAKRESPVGDDSFLVPSGLDGTAVSGRAGTEQTPGPLDRLIVSLARAVERLEQARPAGSGTGSAT